MSTLTTTHPTHTRNRCGTTDQLRQLLAGNAPSKVAKTLKADLLAPQSLNLACTALAEAYGPEAVAVFMSNLWTAKGNAGANSVSKELNADWINEQLGKIV